jgi:hypothetical protein
MDKPAMSDLTPAKPNHTAALVLAALLIVSVVGAAYYYYEYGQAVQSRQQYVDELSTETSRYGSLASNYNSSLSLYNETLSLLASTIAAVNTSLPIYQQASTQLSQLWSRYLALKPAADSLYAADVLIDFGNGTDVWFNDTQVQPGWSMYTETVVLTHGAVQAQWYPEYQEHLVTGIDGVSSSNSMFWFLWTHNSTASSWQTSQVGPDDTPVYNGSVFAWTYCGETASYAPDCSP